MKSKKTLAILIAVFIVLLGGAWFLYSRFGSDPASGQLVAQSTSEASASSESTDASGSSVSAESSASSDSSGSAENSDSGETRPRISPYMIWTATRCACPIISESLLF